MTTEEELPDYVRRNRAAWDRWAPDWVAAGERNWAQAEPSWGIWGIPESELRMLEDVAGLDAIELGCGTAYVSAWLARLGARPVGIDNSARQLETARRLQVRARPRLPADPRQRRAVPYPDATFDLAISEYGAAIWADPYRWIPEAARLLRPGGRLAFLINGYLQMLCAPDSDEPVDRPARARPVRVVPVRMVERRIGRVPPRPRRDDPPAPRQRLRGGGPDRDPGPADGAEVSNYVTRDWARRWPSEEVWKARKRG